jgi:curved DNA-binding protein
MQNFRDYYEILGISKEATADEIKRSYRALARQYHPDLNPGDRAAEEKFKLLSEAYDVLSDADKRVQYEEYSRYWNQKGFKSWNRRGKRSQSVNNAEYSAFEDFDNFVEQLLARHKNDLEASRWESVATVAKEAVSPSRRSSSRESASSAQSDGYSSNSYSSRDNSSARRASYKTQPAAPSRRDAEADLTVPLEKAYAGGRERIRLEDGRSLEVNMPPGMLTGQRIRLKGQGIGGGNLYLRIEVEPHAYFTLQSSGQQSSDVYCQLPITPSEAILGGTIAVPTLGGPVNMMIPPGVQSGQRLRLTGKGYPIGEGLYSDQIVEIEVVMPTVLDDEEKALYQELRKIERFDPRANLPV